MLKTDEHLTWVSESNIAEVKKFDHISVILIQSLSESTFFKLRIHLAVVLFFPQKLFDVDEHLRN